jgi:uncharacterized protein
LIALAEAVPGGVRLRVHAQPRASRTELAGIHDGRLKVRLAAPPVDGAANLELVRFLAGLLGVPRSDISVIRGPSAKQKVLQVRGVSVEEVRRKLGIGGL